jgi:uncharacterized membrane protein YphA (DoxX/SURF4 family)
MGSRTKGSFFSGTIRPLCIPAPSLNAYMVSSLECFGSLFLIIGLASRPLALAIVISMTVAYLIADFEAVSNIFSDPDKFVKADPFPICSQL